MGSSGFLCGEKSRVRLKWGKEIGLEREDWDNWRGKKKTGMRVAKMDRDQREKETHLHSSPLTPFKSMLQPFIPSLPPSPPSIFSLASLAAV